MATKKDPRSETTRTLEFQGVNGDDVSFVEHLVPEGGDPVGITLVVFDKAAWAKAGAPMKATVTVKL